jgi:hypothetical protein
MRGRDGRFAWVSVNPFIAASPRAGDPGNRLAPVEWTTNGSPRNRQPLATTRQVRSLAAI